MDNRDAVVARHVDAIQVAMHANVICLLVQGDDGRVSVVAPADTEVEVLEVLAHTDWTEAYNRVARHGDGQN
jgi:hypothetical protein